MPVLGRPPVPGRLLMSLSTRRKLRRGVPTRCMRSSGSVALALIAAVASSEESSAGGGMMDLLGGLLVGETSCSSGGVLPSSEGRLAAPPGSAVSPSAAGTPAGVSSAEMMSASCAPRELVVCVAGRWKGCRTSSGPPAANGLPGAELRSGRLEPLDKVEGGDAAALSGVAVRSRSSAASTSCTVARRAEFFGRGGLDATACISVTCICSEAARSSGVFPSSFAASSRAPCATSVRTVSQCSPTAA
mmetsp:Transcript_9224/g.23298  ORF Transcript_9224/g.23298 Transcript_9224/m.23298 type:complete len:246 (-) Transcript_9224:13-750(-)